jgi:hypothetical protein
VVHREYSEQRDLIGTGGARGGRAGERPEGRGGGRSEEIAPQNEAQRKKGTGVTNV